MYRKLESRKLCAALVAEGAFVTKGFKRRVNEWTTVQVYYE